MNPAQALLGPIGVTTGVHPETLLPLAFLVVYDEDQGDQAVVLGGSDDITTLLTSLVRTQNLMLEAEGLIQERGIDTPEQALGVLTEVVARYTIQE